jgi:hypothetical protein
VSGKKWGRIPLIRDSEQSESESRARPLFKWLVMAVVLIVFVYLIFLAK